MRLKGIAFGLATVALIISIVPSTFACYAYTPGYWKHNVTVYVEERRDNSYAADVADVKESDASMEAYEDWIIANRDSGFTLEWAYEQFWMRGPGRQPIRQMIADWFNEAKDAWLKSGE